jgi:hypothetical protein
VADLYGVAALTPKSRRRPQMPEATTPIHVVEALLTLAVLEPTIGRRQYADQFGDQGFSIARSTAQKHLVAHGLGKRVQRLPAVLPIRTQSANGSRAPCSKNAGVLPSTVVTSPRSTNFRPKAAPG